MERDVVALTVNGAHDRNRTDEPLPYQGSALPTELRGQQIDNRFT